MPTKIIALLLSFLSFFAFWKPNAQPNNIPETRTQPFVGDLAPDAYGIWPTKDFTEGDAPFLLPQAMTALYAAKGKKDGGAHTDSLLVLRKGRLVHEYYADGWDADTPHEMYSVTKSVAATLIGAAIQDGYIEGINQKVSSFFEDAVIPEGQESKLDMTIEHLLTMTSGIVCDKDAWWDAYFAEDMEDSGLWAYLLPQKYAPGEKYAYDSVAPTILLAIVSRATSRDLLEYAQETLFSPLGMTSVEWQTTADGLPCGGFGISMTPRDMLRLGYLYLNCGRWEDSQILPGDFVAQAGPRSMAPNAYGHTFWNNEMLPFFGFYEADGAYGQFISIYPQLDMVVVRTGTEKTN